MTQPTRRAPATVRKVVPVQRAPQTPPATQMVEGRATVNTQYKVNKDERSTTHHETVEEVVRFEPGEVPAHVRVSVGKTIATAPYESVRIDVSVSLPCLASSAAIDATYARASALTEQYLSEEETRWVA